MTPPRELPQKTRDLGFALCLGQDSPTKRDNRIPRQHDFAFLSRDGARLLARHALSIGEGKFALVRCLVDLGRADIRRTRADLRQQVAPSRAVPNSNLLREDGEGSA